MPVVGQPAMGRTDGEVPTGTVRSDGVAAAQFRPEWWQAGTLNFNFDARAPMLEPRAGAFRNIYAPSVVREDRRWRLLGVNAPRH